MLHPSLPRGPGVPPAVGARAADLLLLLLLVLLLLLLLLLLVPPVQVLPVAAAAADAAAALGRPRRLRRGMDPDGPQRGEEEEGAGGVGALPEGGGRLPLGR